MWAAMVFWTGKVAGVMVADTAVDAAGRLEYTAASDGRWQWTGARAWNVVCLAAVANRIAGETWPAMVLAARQPGASCYDTVCGGEWCVYACVYYAVAWLERISEMVALAAAVTWRLRSTVDCLNSAATGSGHLWDADTDDCTDRAHLPWHVYLTVAFPVVRFAVTAVNQIPALLTDGDVWHAMTATAAIVASCSPVVAHGTVAALLAVANNSMRSINRRIVGLHVAAMVGRPQNEDRLSEIARLARKHWWTTELVTGRVCAAYGVDLMMAVLLAAVHVTYVAVSVFRRLTNVTDAQTNIVSVSVVMQLTGWFGQFFYLAYTCDDLANRVGHMICSGWPTHAYLMIFRPEISSPTLAHRQCWITH